MATNYVKPASRFDQVEWKMICPVESYSIIRSIAAQDPKSINQHDKIRIEGRLRNSGKLHNHLFELCIWKSDTQIIGNENPPHLSIGGLTFVGASEGIKEDCFCIDQPIQPNLFEDIVQSFIYKIGNRDVFHEIHLTVIGLLNGWNKKGSLDVTDFRLELHFLPNIDPVIKTHDLIRRLKRFGCVYN